MTTRSSRLLRLSRRDLVVVFTVLVVAASGVVLALSLTRPEQPAVRVGAAPVVADDGTYTPGELAGPADGAVAAATRVLPLALTYDVRDLEGSLTAATRGMTDDYAEEFARLFAATAVPAARRDRGVTDALVRAAGVVRVEEGDERALCLLYVDQRVVAGRTVRRGSEPALLSRVPVLVELERVDGEWLVDGIRPV